MPGVVQALWGELCADGLAPGTSVWPAAELIGIASVDQHGQGGAQGDDDAAHSAHGARAG
ncbi:hypothetical protein P1S61_03405 [Streptomyces sp. ME08-AFT2]|uniref:hypothetical protein n=1 Tax=Streptomyces sp. ME08-AFT2 TaxID=3028683 RepID=UPI0029AD0B22|nr:hypothetical protein [Streptomyces sp. ME08-AFT2]MDX3308167.1 hypothetical protein [Streptomyces sp. ME08-AFT2]